MIASKQSMPFLGPKEQHLVGIIRSILVHDIGTQQASTEAVASLRFVVDTKEAARVLVLDRSTLARLCHTFGKDMSKWFGRKLKLYRHQNDAGEWQTRMYPLEN